MLASPAAEALRLIVHDLFIFRGTTSHTNQEKKEYESQRDAVFLMVKQLDGHPEVRLLNKYVYYLNIG